MKYAIKGGVPLTPWEPVKTLEDAHELANEMAKNGNYPAGMSPCFTAGINGNDENGCPFKGEDFCKCAEMEA